MNKEVIINDEPLQKITFKDFGFIIYDESSNHNNEYLFEKIENIQIEFKKINWFISVVSILIDLITGSAMGGIFKSKSFIINFNYSDKRINYQFKISNESAENDIRKVFSLNK